MRSVNPSSLPPKRRSFRLQNPLKTAEKQKQTGVSAPRKVVRMNPQPNPYHTYITATVRDGRIFAADNYRGEQEIGVTSQAYLDLQKRYDELAKQYNEYYARLVELGEIEPELTTEDLIRQQAALIVENTKAMKDMQAQIAALTKPAQGKKNEPA
jgi:hypothetical protein